jgi:amino acid permease
MTVALFVAVSIPNFGAILSFIGGLTINLCTFILPSVFYVQLKRKMHQLDARCVKKIKRIVVISSRTGCVQTWEWLVNGVIVGRFGK